MVARARTIYCELCHLSFMSIQDNNFEQNHADECHGGAFNKEHLEALKELDILYPQALVLKPISIFPKISKD